MQTVIPTQVFSFIIGFRLFLRLLAAICRLIFVQCRFISLDFLVPQFGLVPLFLVFFEVLLEDLAIQKIAFQFPELVGCFFSPVTE